MSLLATPLRIQFSLSICAAFFLWPSISRASVEVFAWTSSSPGLFLSSTQYPTLSAWNAGAAAAHVAPGAFAPTGLTFQSAFNITNTDIIIDADNAADAQAAYSLLYQAAAAGNDGGNWDGPHGMFSDASQTSFPNTPSAATDPRNITGIGVVLNDGNGANLGGNDPAYTQFDEMAVDANSVLVKFTYDGDTDLDGIIEPYDINVTENAFAADQSHGAGYKSGWVNGDSDYLGTVDGVDVSNVQAAYQFQESDPIVSPSDASPPRVPEPGSILLAAFGAVGILFIRRVACVL